MAGTRTRTVGAAAVALAVAAGVVAVQPSAGADPGAPLDPGLRWQLSVAGAVVATSSQCTGLGSRSDVREIRSGSDPSQVVKDAGALHWTDVTCAFPLSGDRSLYEWRRQVEVAGAGAARERVDLTLLDVEGAPVQAWRLTGAWPSQYLVGPDRLVVTLTHEQAVLQ